MKAFEVNFDAIVGPTHNYAGLAFGNVASQKNKQSISNPRQAALEGLAKMQFLADLGVPQAVLPPPLRPDVKLLSSIYYSGDDAILLRETFQNDPALLAAVSSASAMWAANAATVSPSCDIRERRVHISPANLISQFHRSIETPTTSWTLKMIFNNVLHFYHHPPLPAHARWADEGAANHTRLCGDFGSPGLHVFVFGQRYDELISPLPKTFPARQTEKASFALARRHQLREKQTVFIQQNPEAIDAGVFHNDVAAVGNQNVFLCHEQAYLNQQQVLDEMCAKFAALTGMRLWVIEVTQDELTLQEAVQTYLFNSQIVTLPDGTMAMIAPAECETHPRARDLIERLLAAGTPIKSVHYLSVRQSMRNGGGPACLRLRVVLNEEELAATHQGVFLTDVLYHRLVDWVTRHYREELRLQDLADMKLLQESTEALEELMQILGFQKPDYIPMLRR